MTRRAAIHAEIARLMAALAAAWAELATLEGGAADSPASHAPKPRPRPRRKRVVERPVEDGTVTDLARERARRALRRAGIPLSE